MNVTIVIPTHNRGEKLLATVHRLLANDVSTFDEVEIIVVDDGSIVPAGPMLEGLVTPWARSDLRCIRLHPNLGPAGARNAGFRCGRGGIVLFVDDDILAPTDLIRRHVEAHRVHRGSIVCGSWRNVAPDPMTPLYRYVASLGADDTASSTEEFVRTADHLERPYLVGTGDVPVGTKVSTGTVSRCPAAEEYELSYRLRELGIPVLLATQIVAMHDHPVTLDSMCRQTFKHAMGCAEAAVKCPATHGVKGGPPYHGHQWTNHRTGPSHGGLQEGGQAPSWVRALPYGIAGDGQADRASRTEFRAAPGALTVWSWDYNFFAGVRAGIKSYGELREPPDLGRIARQASPAPLV